MKNLKDHIKNNREHLDFKRMPENSNQKFEALLKQKLHHKEKPRTTINGYSALKVAASILLLIGAYSLGKYHKSTNASSQVAFLEKENVKMKQATMLSLIGNTSPNKRIEGINFIDSLPEADPDIIEALIDRMLYDINANVRFTALRGLEEYASLEGVKNALIKALKTEKDSKVLVSIIQTLISIQEKKAVEPIQQLLVQDELIPPVKAHIEKLLPQLL